MGILEDILSALERIPGWKRIKESPERIDALEQRLKAIERLMAGGSGQLCPICNSPKFKRTASKPDPGFEFAGVMRDFYRCEECGHSENRQRRTMG